MKRSQIALETVEICQAGAYSRNGQQVSLQPVLGKSVANTRLFDLKTWARERTSISNGQTQIRVTAETTLSAVLRMASQDSGHLACLNFASARNPGGGFLGGAEAQEESLARSSTLYPCLMAVPEHYARNRASGSLIYLDLAIWSPQVAFIRDDSGRLLEKPAYVSVITSAAPNAGAVEQNRPELLGEVRPALERRSRFVLEVAASQGVRRIILGAWGCGVFRNDPAVVAEVFAQLLGPDGSFYNAFDEVVFAIYDRTLSKGVLTTFEKAFSNCRQTSPQEVSEMKAMRFS